MRTAVVGAGLAGITAARELTARGCEVVVFDKARGPAGRTSTRHSGDFDFDHGAQYFTARDPRLVRAVSNWQQAGFVQRWNGRLVAIDDGGVRPVSDETTRYVGVPGMNAIAKHLARDLDVRSGVRIDSIEGHAGAWALLDGGGTSHGEFERILLTVPPAQAVQLLPAESPLHSVAEAVEFHACWAVMLGLSHPVECDFDGAFVNRGPLAWVARNSSKPGRPPGEAWVLHATPEWSRRWLRDDPETVIDDLILEFERIVGKGRIPVIHRAAHRWKFSGAVKPLDMGALCDSERGLALAGDWCCGSRVEGAFLSGLAATEICAGSVR